MRRGAIEVIEAGDGPRVVMVHGDISGAERTWSEQRPLADSHQLLMVNRRGFGGSDDTDGEDFEIDAHDAAALFDGGVHLVGHSYGGVVSLLAASLRPDDVRSLVVFEPPAFGVTPDHPDVVAFIAKVSALVAERPSADEFMRGFVAAVGGNPDVLPSPLPPPLLKAAMVQMNGRWPWEAEIPLDTLAAAAFPKLVVSGGHSIIFDAVCDVLETRLGARREVLVGAGHSIPALGDPVNDLLREFWASAT